MVLRAGTDISDFPSVKQRNHSVGLVVAMVAPLVDVVAESSNWQPLLCGVGRTRLQRFEHEGLDDL